MRSWWLGVIAVLLLVGPVSAQAQTGPSFTVRDVGTVSGVLGWRGADLELPLALKELSGQAVDLTVPVLVSLERDTKTGPVTVVPGAVEVVNDGAPITTLRLAPHERTTVFVRVRGLHDVGTYTGQFAVSAAGVEVTSALTLKVRRPFVVAALLILLGVVVSAVLLQFTGAYRDGLRMQGGVELLALRLKQALDALPDTDDAEAKKVVDSVRRQVEELKLRLESESPPTQQQLRECEQKVAALRAYVSCAVALSGVDEAHRNFELTRQWFECPVDDEDISKLREAGEKALADLAELANTLASALGRSIFELRKEIDSTLAQVARTGRTDLVPALNSAREELDKSAAALVNDRAAAQQHYEAAAQICADIGKQQGLTMGIPVQGENAGANAVEGVKAPNPLRKTGLRAKYVDFLVTAIVGVIAVVLGLQLLWVDQLAWGTPYDLIVAFLWGLGLHPVGGTVFGGLQGLRDKITGPPVKA